MGAAVRGGQSTSARSALEWRVGARPGHRPPTGTGNGTGKGPALMAVYFYLTLGPPQGAIAAGSAQQCTRGFTWRGIVFSGRAKWQRSPGCPSAHWNAFADSASAPSSFALALARSDTSSLTSSRTSTLAALVRPHRSLRLPHDACLHPLGSRVRRSAPRRTPASARCEARGRRLTAYGSSTRRPPPRSRPLPDRRCLAPPASF